MLLAPITKNGAEREKAGEMQTATVPDRRDDQSCVPVCVTRRPNGGRVLVVEDHALVAAGLKMALSNRSWCVETTAGPTPRDVVDDAQRFHADCVLMDIHLRNGLGSGIDLIEPLVSAGARVVMLTAERRRAVLAECLEAGAAGWIKLSADLDEVDATLSKVLAGRAIVGRTERAELLERLRSERRASQRAQAIFEQLTPREALVLGALTDGLTAEEIAREHFVAVTTVRSQIRAVLQKLGVRSQLAAVAVADAHRELLPQQEHSGRDRRRADPQGRGCGPEFSVRTA